MRFLSPTALAVALLTGSGTFPAVSAYASDSWLCTRNIDNKPIVTKYQVNGSILVVNGGAARLEILENNSDHLISYGTFFVGRSSQTQQCPTRCDLRGHLHFLHIRKI
jgi:hypothetical protein